MTTQDQSNSSKELLQKIEQIFNQLYQDLSVENSDGSLAGDHTTVYMLVDQAHLAVESAVKRHATHHQADIDREGLALAEYEGSYDLLTQKQRDILVRHHEKALANLHQSKQEDV